MSHRLQIVEIIARLMICASLLMVVAGVLFFFMSRHWAGLEFNAEGIAYTHGRVIREGSAEVMRKWSFIVTLGAPIVLFIAMQILRRLARR